MRMSTSSPGSIVPRWKCLWARRFRASLLLPFICVRSSCTRHASCADSKPNKQTKKRHKPLVVSVVVVGLFEEEEEEIGVTSDVVKVKGEDLDTSGYLRGDWVRLGRRRSQIVDASRLPWLAHDKAVGPYKTIPQYQFNTTKQHTLRTTCMRSCCNWIASCVVASPSPSLWNLHRNSFENEAFSTKTSNPLTV